MIDIGLGNTVTAVLLAVTAYFLKRSLDALERLEHKVAEHGERIARLEGPDL